MWPGKPSQALYAVCAQCGAANPYMVSPGKTGLNREKRGGTGSEHRGNARKIPVKSVRSVGKPLQRVIACPRNGYAEPRGGGWPSASQHLHGGIRGRWNPTFVWGRFFSFRPGLCLTHFTCVRHFCNNFWPALDWFVRSSRICLGRLVDIFGRPWPVRSFKPDLPWSPRRHVWPPLTGSFAQARFALNASLTVWSPLTTSLDRAMDPSNENTSWQTHWED